MARSADRVSRGREMLTPMRRIVVLTAVALVGLGFSLAGQPAQAGPGRPPIVVTPGEHGGNTIGVIVESPGSPGSSASQPGPGGTCNAACQAAQQALICTQLFPAALSCDTAASFGGGGATLTPGQLAQIAFGQLSLSAPTASRSPAERLPDGRVYTVVNMHTWFWTDPATYRPVSKRVQAGAVWVVVTARPEALRFDPGNGDGVVSCTGPGRAWRAGADGQWDRAPGGCDYQYRKSTLGYPAGQVTAEAGIVWRVSWVGDAGGTPVSGSLPDLITTTQARFAVAEGQAVVRQ